MTVTFRMYCVIMYYRSTVENDVIKLKILYLVQIWTEATRIGTGLTKK